MALIPNIVRPFDDELTYSYLERLSVANGISSIQDFADYIQSEHRLKMKKPLSFDCHGYVLPLAEEVLPLVGSDVIDFVMDTSILPFSLPTLHRPMQGRMITYYFGYYQESRLMTSISHPIQRIRTCPRCMADEKGRYLHRAHHLPGVTVCHIHGCELDEISPDGTTVHLTSVGDQSLAYAKFCKDFMDVRFTCSFDELKVCIITKLSELGMKYPDLIIAMQADGYDSLCKNLPYFLQNQIQHGLYIDTSALMAVLLYLFRDVGTLKAYLSKVASEEEHIISFGPDYELVGQMRSDVVHLIHKKCGHDYYVSPSAFDSGWECPCDYTDDTALYRRLMKKIGKGSYSLEGPFVSADQAAPLLHVDCGKTVMIKPRRFVFEEGRCPCSYVI